MTGTGATPTRDCTRECSAGSMRSPMRARSSRSRTSRASLGRDPDPLSRSREVLGRRRAEEMNNLRRTPTTARATADKRFF
jgi:hypothetical protein